ncbi:MULTISPECIES: multiheme c-type cytochrome [unclassified Janthinobacterium]|uniref:multiheme c-type cytochrome n=1 Tax=unclassified Janthinobacterium TaxID=2610881 RepID=UPI0003493AA5|nr:MULTISPECIES: multiheme c-type cytochrome [unclassified Janthinobacterium]MEC5163989.1 hypothetical protein [Janthinobacterium sp. CG_S6]
MKNRYLVDMLCRHGLVFGLVFGSLFGAPAQAAPAGAALPNVAAHQSVGTVNCANSGCHGAVTPWTDSHVLQNEYTTWLRLDKHAKAYSVLLNQQSRKIAKNLGLKQPAHESQACLDCHAHNPAPKLAGERHVVAEGVGCEACHGPAEKWIASHVVAGATHADNVKNGMYPTNNPVEQAKLCLSCHFGDENRFVTHRVMAAGHPRISFELGTFATIAPAHYQIDDDWRKRKGDYQGVKIWAIGQALASKQLLDALADPQRGRDGLFPELVLFDCHACHHPMSEQKSSPRLSVGPGKVHLNDSNLLMLRALVRVVDPANANAFNQQVSQVHQAIAGNGAQADPLALAKKLSATIGQYIVQFEKRNFDVATLRDVLKALLNESSVAYYSDYAGAEQAYMSISSLASTLAKQNALASAGEVNRRLGAMRKALANDEKYRAELFGAELAGLRQLISSQVK